MRKHIASRDDSDIDISLDNVDMEYDVMMTTVIDGLLSGHR